MTFNDIFKSGFMEKVSEFSPVDVAIGMVVSLILGLFIFVIYKKTFSGVMYSTSFSLTLIGLSLVTTMVIMAVTSNVVLSLGMVGALSIVRFRAAIKEPMEIVFLFWSIAGGIVVGAGMIPLAVVGSAVIGVVLIVLANHRQRENPYILVINCRNAIAEKDALNLLDKDVKRYSIKSKTVNVSGIEITTEVRIKDATTEFVNRLNEIEDVDNVTLVSYNGEYMA